MSDDRMMLLAFGVAVGAIVYSSLRYCKGLPWPPRLVGAGIFFSLLQVFSLFSRELANVIAIGVVIALIVNNKFSNPDCTPACGTVQPSNAQLQ